jgi:poly(A) polymerase
MARIRPVGPPRDVDSSYIAPDAMILAATMTCRDDNSQYAAARAIVQRLVDAGHQAYLAGGCVRDMLLGREPLDFDVATSATPDAVQQLFQKTQAVGASFGVVLVLPDSGREAKPIEVATFRSDGAYSDGRRPDAVRFSTSPEEDVKRRDFTINGMLLDALKDAPLADSVLDFVGGRDDLRAQLIRAIGDPQRRFAEDKLRMLRAVRFAARLGFAIEDKTLAAIREQAATIAQVSAERVRDELTRILTEGQARRGFELLRASGLLREVLPEIAKLEGIEQPPQYHPEGDVWTHTLMLLDHLPASASATLAWGMLLHDVGKPATFTPPRDETDRIRFNNHVRVGMAIARDVLNRLRFSNDDSAQILSLIEHHMQFGDVMQMKQSTLKRFLRLPKFDEHLALHYADVMSSNKNLQLYDFAKQHHEAMGEEQLRPPLWLTGRELIAAGYRPGAQFKAMLLAAEDAQLEGRIHSAADALALVKQAFGEPPTAAEHA